MNLVLDEAELDAEAVLRVGEVSGVEGRKVRVRVDRVKNSSHLIFRGTVVRNVSVGSYVKISKGFIDLIGRVDGERISSLGESQRDGRDHSYESAGALMSRVLDVSLVGFLENSSFERGIRELPLLGNECFVLRRDEYDAIYRLASSTSQTLRIGSLAMEPTQPVLLDVDGIFASHVGIFGNTGSGKSYTLAKLYDSLFRQHMNDPGFRERSRFVIIDFNGEYVDRADGERSTAIIAAANIKDTYRLSTRQGGGDRVPLPEGLLRDPVFWTVLLDATEKTQAPFVRRALQDDYLDRVLAEEDSLLYAIGTTTWRATRSSDSGIDRQAVSAFLEEVATCLGAGVDSPFNGVIEDFRSHLQFNGTTVSFYWRENGQTTYSSSDGWEALIRDRVRRGSVDVRRIDAMSRFRLRLVLRYYHEIISGYANQEHLGPLIKRLSTRVPDIEKLVTIATDGEDLAHSPLTVISLRNVNLEMRKVLPMLVCKYLYEQKKTEEEGGNALLNLIVDEAHNILSTQSSRESDAWRDYRLETFEEIVKEGRKFGVFLTVASQRPHDISSTIVSQLHNYFLHRLVNDLDIAAIERSVTYLDSISFESLPILSTGSCVIAGTSTRIPVIVKVDALDARNEPDSRTMSVVETWQAP